MITGCINTQSIAGTVAGSLGESYSFPRPPMNSLEEVLKSHPVMPKPKICSAFHFLHVSTPQIGMADYKFLTHSGLRYCWIALWDEEEESGVE